MDTKTVSYSFMYAVVGIMSLAIGLFFIGIMITLNVIGQPLAHVAAFKVTLMLLGFPGALLTLFGFMTLVSEAITRIREHAHRSPVNELMGVYFTSAMIGITGGLIAIFTGLWMPHAHELRYITEPITAMASLCTLGVGLVAMSIFLFRKHARLVRS